MLKMEANHVIQPKNECHTNVKHMFVFALTGIRRVGIISITNKCLGDGYMPLLNGFFYLMLLLAGFSTAMILFDLKKREDRAYAELESLYAGRQTRRAEQGRLAAHDRGVDRLPHRPAAPGSLTQGRVRRDSFLDIDEQKDRHPASAQVSYDFAMTHRLTVNQKASQSQVAYHADTSCCA